ncbi:hypothetical protein TRIATDRAFT_300891 [Trichoderma atroviride IMI 206040]|uniref:Uncharacterized protein n=1 Tax=Hypocrea atroviridis (strain ATCC 20476 / IMI 206040) TaxID=452589 RepID=G9P3A2_HYPAI|nr:uncharacterized protein TRIATDRAFT_300891 [Trichoderma atroviride IMI 206040]EHK42863.1 hypothetical protein TRIATDRAFT_300891 [Trichoderma atroviride IMI 206040]
MFRIMSFSWLRDPDPRPRSCFNLPKIAPLTTIFVYPLPTQPGTLRPQLCSAAQRVADPVAQRLGPKVSCFVHGRAIAPIN